MRARELNETNRRGATVAIDGLKVRDVDALAAALAPLPLLQKYGTTATSLAGALVRAVEGGDMVLSARLAGEPVGVAWVVGDGAFARAAYLRLMAVVPAVHGQGVGAELLREVEVRLADSSSHLLLLASDFNTAAHAFYRRLGYEQVGIIPGFVLPTVDEWIFAKRLVG
ncbi:MAG: GNAT family N-acetyltransferase [Deltaproteobacteria bacterium]|nr:GNAT family N-acetyltransferase [Deltaproteobacteria bacterium]